VLKVILIGVCISVPAIAGYTVFTYLVFRVKTGKLKYARSRDCGDRTPERPRQRDATIAA
jgi:hypothetical protein